MNVFPLDLAELCQWIQAELPQRSGLPHKKRRATSCGRHVWRDAWLPRCYNNSILVGSRPKLMWHTCPTWIITKTNLQCFFSSTLSYDYEWLHSRTVATNFHFPQHQISQSCVCTKLHSIHRLECWALWWASKWHLWHLPLDLFHWLHQSGGINWSNDIKQTHIFSTDYNDETMLESPLRHPLTAARPQLICWVGVASWPFRRVSLQERATNHNVKVSQKFAPLYWPF